MVDRPPQESDQWDRAREDAVQERLTSPRATELEKALAALVGAAEGFLEEARKADLPHLAGRAVQTTEDAARGLREGVVELRQAQGQEPQGGTAPQRGATGSVGEARAAGAAVSHEYPSLEDTPTTQEVAVSEEYVRHGNGGPSRTSSRVEGSLHKAEAYVDAAGQSARRALEAPTAIRSHVKVTAREVMRDVGKSALAGGLLGMFAVFSLLFLSAAVAIAIGGVGGWVLVGVVYAVGAGIAWAVAQSAAKDAKADARTGAAKIKTEARNVAEPLRNVRG